MERGNEVGSATEKRVLMRKEARIQTAPTKRNEKHKDYGVAGDA